MTIDPIKMSIATFNSLPPILRKTIGNERYVKIGGGGWRRVILVNIKEPNR